MKKLAVPLTTLALALIAIVSAVRAYPASALRAKHQLSGTWVSPGH